MASRAKNAEDLKLNTHQNPPDGVVIFSVLRGDADRVVLVRQYRYTLDDYIYEFPAGLVDEGEDYHAAAIRELKEETDFILIQSHRQVTSNARFYDGRYDGMNPVQRYTDMHRGR